MSYWTSFIGLLCNFPYDQDQCRREFINAMKAYYIGNTSEMKYVEDFENQYQSDRAIWWYTRDTFIYRILNKALRQHNVELLFLCGFFVQDIYKQLNNIYEQHKSDRAGNDHVVQVYRGQLISRRELARFQLEPAYIGVNSFFSTTLNRALASLYTGPSEKTDEFQSVLFGIELNLYHDLCLPFGDISSFSSFPNESEVLFMVGTRFIVDKVDNRKLHYDDIEHKWKVKLKLQCNDYLKDYRDLQRSTRRKTLKACVDVLLSHRFMLVMESSDVTGLIFQKLVFYFPDEQNWISAIESHCLARHQFFRQNKYPESLSAYEQALQLWLKYQHDVSNNDEILCTIDIGHLHKEIGFYYKRIPSDQQLANKHYDLAISSYKSTMHNDNLSVSTTDENEEIVDISYYIADIYGNYKTEVSQNDNERTQNCLLAIEYLEKHICDLMKVRSVRRLVLAERLKYLATLYQSTLIHDKAVYNFDRALELYRELQQESNGNLNEINNICDKLIKICSVEQRQDYNLVLKYRLIQQEYLITENNKKSNGHDKMELLARNYDDLACTYTALNQLDLAHQNRDLASELYKKISGSHKKNSD